jgi:hypothetical protein
MRDVRRTKPRREVIAMAEERTFYRHDGVRSHDVGAIADAAKRAAQEDHDEQYGRAGTFEFLRFEDYPAEELA